MTAVAYYRSWSKRIEKPVHADGSPMAAEVHAAVGGLPQHGSERPWARPSENGFNQLILLAGAAGLEPATTGFGVKSFGFRPVSLSRNVILSLTTLLFSIVS